LGIGAKHSRRNPIRNTSSGGECLRPYIVTTNLARALQAEQEHRLLSLLKATSQGAFEICRWEYGGIIHEDRRQSIIVRPKAEESSVAVIQRCTLRVKAWTTTTARFFTPRRYDVFAACRKSVLLPTLRNSTRGHRVGRQVELL